MYTWVGVLINRKIFLDHLRKCSSLSLSSIILDTKQENRAIWEFKEETWS